MHFCKSVLIAIEARIRLKPKKTNPIQLLQRRRYHTTRASVAIRNSV